jgi:hypothetical protein
MIALRILALLALAAGLGVVAIFVCDAIIGPTHNVAAVLVDLIAGAIVALLTLGIGGYQMYKWRATVKMDSG